MSLVLSLIIVLVGGFLIGYIFEKVKIPKIVGMIIYGILIGSSFLNIVSNSLLGISSILRQIALVIIITRAGLNLDFKRILEMGLPAILLSFIPATFEIVGILIFAPILLGLSVIESLLLGSVLAAVSPAIIVPRMIKLKEEGYSGVPDLILVGSSIDDVYVIVLFYTFLGMIKTNSFNLVNIVQIPTSIILGGLIGIIIGYIISFLFKKVKINRWLKVFLTLLISFTLVYTEKYYENYLKIATLISVLTLNMTIYFKNNKESESLEKDYKKLWFIFEILLFVLVGISVDLSFAVSSGIMPIFVLLIALVFRSIGTFLTSLFTNYSFKEKLFIILAYLPKATVQASIGAIALNEGLPSGNIILTMAVIAILITAPLGAILIDSTHKYLLVLDQKKHIN